MQEKLNTQDSQRAYVRVIDYIKQEIRIGNEIMINAKDLV